MRPFCAALLAAALCACSVDQGADQSSGQHSGQAPDGVLQTPALEGNWIVINYWATWCAPCKAEIPELNRLAFRNTGLDVYAVNFDEVQGETLLQQAAEMDIQFPLLATDPGPRLGLTRPTVLPTTLILNPAGEETTRLIGPQTEAALHRELALARQQE
jgi:thiol-disulfide isomerase/thioredoxin